MATVTLDLPTLVKIDESAADGTARVLISGNITDTTDFAGIEQITSPRVVFDLGALRRINSRGVIIFMEMMKRMCSKAAVEIHNAGHGFITQYGLIRGFAAGARIQSVQAAFHCEKCGSFETVLLERSQHFPQGQVTSAAAPNCKRCKKLMISDDALLDPSLHL